MKFRSPFTHNLASLVCGRHPRNASVLTREGIPIPRLTARVGMTDIVPLSRSLERGRGEAFMRERDGRVPGCRQMNCRATIVIPDLIRNPFLKRDCSIITERFFNHTWGLCPQTPSIYRFTADGMQCIMLILSQGTVPYGMGGYHVWHQLFCICRWL